MKSEKPNEKTMQLLKSFLLKVHELQVNAIGTSLHFEVQTRNFENDDAADDYGVLVSLCWYDKSLPEDDQFQHYPLAVYSHDYSCNKKRINGVLKEIKRIAKLAGVKL